MCAVKRVLDLVCPAVSLPAGISAAPIVLAQPGIGLAAGVGTRVRACRFGFPGWLGFLSRGPDVTGQTGVIDGFAKVRKIAGESFAQPGILCPGDDVNFPAPFCEPEVDSGPAGVFDLEGDLPHDARGLAV
ncbi:MAG: hypothetical protein C0504_11220 [Candidatus Solibacter sp.]|nr:hypothetical protein [Candidatus Solibacter sp.]